MTRKVVIEADDYEEAVKMARSLKDYVAQAGETRGAVSRMTPGGQHLDPYFVRPTKRSIKITKGTK